MLRVADEDAELILRNLDAGELSGVEFTGTAGGVDKISSFRVTGRRLHRPDMEDGNSSESSSVSLDVVALAEAIEHGLSGVVAATSVAIKREADALASRLAITEPSFARTSSNPSGIVDQVIKSSRGPFGILPSEIPQPLYVLVGYLGGLRVIDVGPPVPEHKWPEVAPSIKLYWHGQSKFQVVRADGLVVAELLIEPNRFPQWVCLGPDCQRHLWKPAAVSERAVVLAGLFGRLR